MRTRPKRHGSRWCRPKAALPGTLAALPDETLQSELKSVVQVNGAAHYENASEICTDTVFLHPYWSVAPVRLTLDCLRPWGPAVWA